MIELVVKSAEFQVEAPLILRSVATLTPTDSRDPVFGEWCSFSRYIGRGVLGKYYVKPSPGGYLPPGMRLRKLQQRPRPSYPVAYFLDELYGPKPFLILDDLDPAYLWSLAAGAHSEGSGSLLRSLATDAVQLDRQLVTWER